MALEHRHAIRAIENWSKYKELKADCDWSCGDDEQHLQTLLGSSIPASASCLFESFAVGMIGGSSPT
jgi:hypothetical protein